MPTKNFYLDDARSEVLTAKWGILFRKFEVFYNGQSLGVVPSLTGLPTGASYPLPDGRVVTAQVIRSFGRQEVELLLSGQPIPGSATHPQERIKQAWYVLLFVGLLTVILGAVAELIDNDVLRTLGLGWYSVGEGLIFLGLGWWGYSRRSAVAFYIALGLLVLDKILTIAAAATAGGGGTRNFGSLVVWAFFCLAIFRGAKAAQELRTAKASAQTAPIA